MVEALLNARKDPDSSVKGSAAKALGLLGANLPKEQAPLVVEALLNALKDPDSSVKGSAANALVVVESHAKKAPSVFFDLDPLTIGDRHNAEIFEDAIRTLASANWAQSNMELLQWLESDDSKSRFFALHVLARRQLDTRTLEQIRALRDDGQERPWVKMAALRCLMEIQREKRVREAETKKQGVLSPPTNVSFQIIWRLFTHAIWRVGTARNDWLT